uniref:hypothetical protein n=1 Tax=Enterobacter cloacae complex sp. 280C5 TaxID=3395861 RepID=UPI003CF248FA
MHQPKRFVSNQLIKSLPPNTSDARSTDAEYSDTEISGLKCLVAAEEKVVKSFCYATFIMDENAPSPLVTGLKWTSILLIRLP